MIRVAQSDNDGRSHNKLKEERGAGLKEEESQVDIKCLSCGPIFRLALSN